MSGIETGSKYPVPIETRRVVSADPFIDIKNGDYPTSPFEKAVEGLSIDLDGWMNGAVLKIPEHGSLLTRISQPVIITHPETGEHNLLQVQWTRFSPLAGDISYILEAYRRNGEKIEVRPHLENKIKKPHDKKLNPFSEVSDPEYFPGLVMDGWEEKAYYGVYSLDKLKELPSPEELKPFYIFNPNTTIFHREAPGGIRPAFFVTLSQNPVFDGQVMNEYAYVANATFPDIQHKQKQAFGTAVLEGNYRSGSPLKIPEGTVVNIQRDKMEYKFPQQVPQEEVFNFTHTVLRRWLGVEK